MNGIFFEKVEGSPLGVLSITVRKRKQNRIIPASINLTMSIR